MSASFTPSPQELAIVSQIFAQADPQKLGIITGEVAVRVFGGAKLSPTVLGEIWSFSDEDNKGWLSRKGVAIAVRLMGWAQKGEPITKALIDKPGPLPRIEGISVPAIVQHNTGKSPPPGLPLLTSQDRTKFQRLFATCGPTNGLLSGDRAQVVFVKSKLPVEKLSQIWTLADTQDRGALDITDFTIAMYLIQACMSGQLSFIPTTLPPGLHEQASGKVASHATGGSSFSSHTPLTPRPVQPQYTGSNVLQPQSTGLPFKSVGPPLPSRPPAFTNGQQPWDVTAAEKANADRCFDGLDTQNKGYIEGDVAVPFMLLSKLPEDVLAQVWDLADINNDGRLTRDGFAVAMHLIQGKIAGKEIPAVLPQSLIPPSMRMNSSPFAVPPSQPPPSEPLKDLLWDDTPPPSAAPQPQPPQPSILQAQTTGFGQQQSPFSIPATQSAVSRDPFGSSFSVSANKDLLGDDNDVGTATPPLQDQSAEIGNAQNQLNSTNRSSETTKAERVNLEQTLATQAAQLSALQTQLSSAKAAYETETKLLAALRERHAAQSADIQKAREELIHAESDLSAVRVEKAEVEGAFLRDKEEVRALQRQMTEVGTETETLKTQVEKAKKEAKQQKGRVAIAKKQLSTKETERLKVEKELEEANQELHETIAEAEATEAELAKETPAPIPSGVKTPERAKSPGNDSVSFAAAHALPATPDVGSPSGSILTKSNNPFERIAASSVTSSPRSQSPFLPFANTSTPTPPTAPAPASIPERTPTTNDEDPFGFSQAFESEPPAQDTNNDIGNVTPLANDVATPRGAPPGLDFSAASNRDSIVSPTSDSEFFSTPPTTAHAVVSPQNETHEAPTRLSSIDQAISQFPPIETHIPGHFPEDTDKHEHTETDLSSQLKELEVEVSDSDDEDNEPLADRRASLVDGKASNNVTAAPAPAISAFDDAFGKGAISQEPKSPFHQANVFGAPAAKVSSPFDLTPNNALAPPTAPAAGGVNDFDEALGKIPSKGTTPVAPQFSFDSAFDDNFDFASASTFPPAPAPATTQSAFPPAPTAVHNIPPVNGNFVVPPQQNSGFDNIFAAPPANQASASQPATEAARPFSFDSAFGTNSAPAPTANQAAATSTDANHEVSFDEAFGGFGTNNALNLDSTLGTFSSASSKGSAIPEAVDTTKPFPTTVSPPVSPKNGASFRIASVRSSSPPPRSASPQRVSSPKPRPSTSSSGKDIPDKAKEPPTRHSKLSIRLPFGKKKKNTVDTPPPPSMSHFLPAVEEPRGAATPAVDDDVDAVKQLCGMGFSRTQAVTALEKNAYDVQRALNSLLGS